MILGGSQGAQAVNTLVTEALCSLTDAALQQIKVIHQTGDKDEEQVQNAYQKRGVDAVVAGFFMHMDEVYAQADLVVSRAGATTLSELAVLGKPTILIPYPFAADNHQEINGQYYVWRRSSSICAKGINCGTTWRNYPWTDEKCREIGYNGCSNETACFSRCS